MRTSSLVPAAMLVIVSACSATAEDDSSSSIDALVSEGTPDTPLAKAFLEPASTAFERGRPGAIRYVIIHDIEGSALSAVGTFRQPGAQTSAHYIVDSAGAVIQMVHEADLANHAGHAAYNGYAIGIEHAGHAKHDEYTDAEYRGSAKLAAEIVKRHGIPIDQDHIIGHSQVPRTDGVLTPCSRTSTICGGRSQHDDPGPHWDWTKYMALVKAAALDLGYSGVGGPDPEITIAPVEVLATTHALPPAYWLTQCSADGETQTAYKTIENALRAESRYLQKTVGPCGDAEHGVYPFVLHGLAQADVHALSLHACESGEKQTYAVAGDVPCGVGSTCAVAALVAGTTGACP